MKETGIQPIIFRKLFGIEKIELPPHAVAKFMKVLEALDIPVGDREGIKTFVYYVENGEAKKLIEVLIAEVTLDDKLQFGIGWLLKGSTRIEGNRAGILGGFTTEPTNFFETTGKGEAREKIDA